jgi:type IV pilus assembly protein PilY1
LGGLLTFNTYQPFTRDLCQTEGLGYLYGLYYQTGTAWYEDVFGEIDADADPRQENPIRMELGKGLSTTPNIHVGKEEGGKAFVQTSVGKIKEIPQPNMPDKTIKSGRVKWRDIEE